MKIAEGDIFLFFGWFRRVEQREGRFCYQRDAGNLHMMFGWLKIGEIWRQADEVWRDSHDKELNIPDWAKDHPHVTKNFTENTIYVAAPIDTGYEAGTFRSVVDDLILTIEGQKNRSRWRLPKWIYPSEGKAPLSYHSNLGRWTRHESHAYLQSVGRGQEFVLDTRDYPQAVDWISDLIKRNRLTK